MQNTDRFSRFNAARRRLIAAGAAFPAYAWTGAARAQAKPPLVIGWISPGSRESNMESLNAFHEVNVGTVPTRTAANNSVEGYSVIEKLPARKVCTVRLVGTLRFAHPCSLGVTIPQPILVRATKLIE